MDITDVLTAIEETDKNRVDKCIIYSDIILFLTGFKENFGINDTGSKIKNMIGEIIVDELKNQCQINIDKTKDFIKFNLIK